MRHPNCIHDGARQSGLGQAATENAWFKANPTAKCFLKTSALIRRNHAWDRRSFEEPSSEIHRIPEAFITSEDIDMWLRFLGMRVSLFSATASRSRLSGSSATAVHGWKNHFYRELAKEFYLVRQQGEQDELEKTGKIIEPAPPQNTTAPESAPPAGKNFRGDLLGFHYSVVINARDWSRNYPDHSNGLAGWLATEANLSRDYFPLVAYSSGQNGSMVQRENTGGD